MGRNVPPKRLAQVVVARCAHIERVHWTCARVRCTLLLVHRKPNERMCSLLIAHCSSHPLERLTALMAVETSRYTNDNEYRCTHLLYTRATLLYVLLNIRNISAPQSVPCCWCCFGCSSHQLWIVKSRFFGWRSRTNTNVSVCLGVCVCVAATSAGKVR